MATESKVIVNLPVTEPPVNESHAISIKLPQFWASNPQTWFIQAESQFSISKIKSETDRYHYVISALTQDVIETVIDFIQSPPNENLYSNFKKLLIDRHSLSVEKRIEKLISSEQLGDRKPSELFRSFSRLAGSAEGISEQLIKKLWLRRLPQVINLALIPQSDKPVSEMLSLADQIWEATQYSQISCMSTHSSSSASTMQSAQITELKDEINNLKDMIYTLSVNNQQHTSQYTRSRNFNREHSENRNRSNSRYRSYSLNRSNNKPHNAQSRTVNSYSNQMCWYHSRFGQQATRCQAPCSFRNRNVSIKHEKN